MFMRIRRLAVLAIVLGGTITGTSALLANDWPEWRGPSRDGRSSETNLPASWSTKGDNLAWRIPVGGRSAPVVFGNRLYLLTVVGGPADTQERLVAIEAESGKVLWDRRFSIYLSDVPQHRSAWASPAVDPETGNIYVFTVGAQLFAISPDGKVLWDRSLPEDYGAVTTHGGRTTSPIVQGDKVILNTLLLAWGDLNRPGNRYMAFDKRTGQTVWVSSPQARHYDTNYSTPIVVDIDPSTGSGQGSTQALIVGGTDGSFHAIKVNTGEPIWRVDVSKRAILNSVLYRDGTVYLTHGEENIGTTEMGMIAAIDARRKGDLKEDAFKWKTLGFLPTYASPVMDNERLYTVDNSAIVAAFDLQSGKRLWERGLGTLQKGSPLLADGKLYVGTENGRFYILKPSATGVEVLDEEWLGSQEAPEVIVASPIVADGRIYVTSMDATYAIGKRVARSASTAKPAAPGRAAASTAAPAFVQIFPYESLLAPGQKQNFRLRVFDANGTLIREEKAAAATWALDQLGGAVSPDGVFTAPTTASAGFVKATIGGVTGTARVRVIPPLPWTYDFESAPAAAAAGAKPDAAAEAPPTWWTGAPTKVFQRTVENVGKVLVRPRDETVGRRAKVIMGPANLKGYTIESDVRVTEQRRQRGDAGLINQRYALVLFGNGQKLELHPWQAADEMTVRVPFKWDANTWYRMKLRVDSRPDGSAHVRGKVWPTGTPEPAAWTIEKVDKIPHLEGSPGLYGDGISELYFDNVNVYPNK
jgi:outer membrane protein assembly factor BamB